MALNESQKEVALSEGQPLWVCANAGSGKSTVLTTKVGYMVKNGKENILVISFTRNSRKDLEKKIYKLVLKDSSGKRINIKTKVKISTFHSICGEILRKEGYNLSNIIKPYEAENIFGRVLGNEAKINSTDIMGWIGYQKNNMIGVDDEPLEKDSEYLPSELKVLYKEYEKYKTEHNCYDLDDYLILAHEVLKNDIEGKYKYDYVMVDEAQDSNGIQFELTDMLCKDINGITITGDYRQCLYEFRGSRPELFMKFPNTHNNTKIVNMNINYRSDKIIIDNANRFSKKYYGWYEHYNDALCNSNDDGDIELIVNEDKDLEAQSICDKIQTLLGLGYKPNDIAVIYRNNIQSQLIENELRTRGVDYFIEQGGGFFNRKEIDIIMCMLRLIHNCDDNVAYSNIFKYRVEPFKYISGDILSNIIKLSSQNEESYLESSLKVYCQLWQKRNLKNFYDNYKILKERYEATLSLNNLIDDIIQLFKLENYINDNYDGEEVKERLESVNNLKKFIKANTLDSFLKFVYDKNDSSKEPKNNDIIMMTIHKAKGLQWKVVILSGLETGKFPSERSDIESEARVFYVAVTRPESKLILSQIGSYNQFAEEYFGRYAYGLLK